MNIRILIFLLLPCLVQAQEYFPGVSFSPRSDLDQLRKGFYVEKLEALTEGPLSNLPSASDIAECYRFTWLRTSQHPVSFRVEVSRDGVASFYLKVADGRGGYAPGNLFRDEKWKLSGDQLISLRKAFERSNFFQLASNEESDGLDGSNWLVEARIDGRYNAVSRWSPKEGYIREIGLAFIDIAVMDFAPVY